MRVGLALRAFFRILFNRQLAMDIQRALDAGTSATLELPEPSTPVPKSVPLPAAPKRPARNDAITLLATLQREARFIDLVKESLEQYSDAQVGAAARDVLRDCAQVLDRLFGLCPVMNEQEGASVRTPSTIDSGTYRLSGQVSGSPPYAGRLVHHGWQAQQCQLPQWNGSVESQQVIAPAEIEVA